MAAKSEHFSNMASIPTVQQQAEALTTYYVAEPIHLPVHQVCQRVGTHPVISRVPSAYQITAFAYMRNKLPGKKPETNNYATAPLTDLKRSMLELVLQGPGLSPDVLEVVAAPLCNRLRITINITKLLRNTPDITIWKNYLRHALIGEEAQSASESLRVGLETVRAIECGANTEKTGDLVREFVVPVPPEFKASKFTAAFLKGVLFVHIPRKKNRKQVSNPIGSSFSDLFTNGSPGVPGDIMHLKESAGHHVSV